MSTISPGEFLSVAGAADPESLIEANFNIATRRLYSFLPTYENNAATTVKGPPTAAAHVLNEFWRDALGAEYVCTAAGTPGTWKQVRPAFVAANPTGIPTGYWISRTDLNFVGYYYDGAAWQLVVTATVIGLGSVPNVKQKLDATAAPTVTDDSGSGYAVGSRWINLTTDKEYVCTDASVGAAVWTETTAGAAGGEANTASNVGTGVGLFKQKTAVDLEFKSLTSGAGINVAASGASEVLVKVTLSATNMLLGRSTAGAGDVEEIACTSFARTLLDDVDAATARGTLGLGSAATMTGPSGTIVGTSDAQTLTGKTLTNPAYTDQTLTDGATINWDTNSGGIATVTLGGNRTVAAPTNLKKGTYILVVKQDATGSRTLTWNAVFKWAGGTAPTLSTAANAVDILTFYCDGTNLYGVAQTAFA